MKCKCGFLIICQRPKKTKGERGMQKRIAAILGVMCICAAYADTETIKWYVDGNVYNTTTCQSGGDVNMPTPPSKTGYTFAGWVVALYDFSTLDPDVAGTNNTYNTTAMTWTTAFPYGVVSGKALCSVTGGAFAQTGNPDTGTEGGQYCWCKATGYISEGSNIVYENVSSSPWVFRYDPGSASDCASNCASSCGISVWYRSDFRRAVFGAVGA